MTRRPDCNTFSSAVGSELFTRKLLHTSRNALAQTTLRHRRKTEKMDVNEALGMRTFISLLLPLILAVEAPSCYAFSRVLSENGFAERKDQ